MTTARSATYALRLGQVVIGLSSPESGFAEFLAQYFGVPSDPAPPTITVEVGIARDDEPCAVPNSLLLTKRVDGDGFDIADGLVRGRFDAAAGRGEVVVRSTLLRGQMMRVFEQLIYQMFHSARRAADYDALLVHSAGVVRAGRGYLFVGPSEAGKSTVAALSREHEVLNDEMNLVEFRADGPVLVGTPFNAFFPGKVPGRAPLAEILLLEQAPQHALADADPATAAAELAAQVAPPVGLEDAAPPTIPALMLELAARLLEQRPARRLRFRRDPGFWEVMPT